MWLRLRLLLLHPLLLSHTISVAAAVAAVLAVPAGATVAHGSLRGGCGDVEAYTEEGQHTCLYVSGAHRGGPAHVFLHVWHEPRPPMSGFFPGE